MQPTQIRIGDIMGTDDGKDKKAAKKMKRLFEYLESIQGQNFTGYIKVNFSQGAVGRIEKFEEILSK